MRGTPSLVGWWSRCGCRVCGVRLGCLSSAVFDPSTLTEEQRERYERATDLAAEALVEARAELRAAQVADQASVEVL